MRTIEEIVAKVHDGAWDDVFGTRVGDLIEFLPYDDAKPFLKETIRKSHWDTMGYPRPLTREVVVEQIREYMPFAWDKANNCRGNSAARTICHMQAWLWLLGVDDDTLENKIGDYEYYGKPQLRSICEALNIQWSNMDNGRWVNWDDEDDDDLYGPPSGPIEGPALQIPE